ncbi:MAG: FAD-dependent oxidoreductase [Acidimicrobiales bacterium]
MSTRSTVVVVGSGAAGLAAGLAACTGGADVVVLERSSLIGGTTALSGGVVWAPASSYMHYAGLQDSPQDAACYVHHLAGGAVDVALVDAFVHDAGRVMGEIEGRSPLRWEMLHDWPDYRGELPGATAGGRSLWPRPLSLPPDVVRRVQGTVDDPTERPRRDGIGPSPGAASAPASDGAVLRGPVRGRVLVGGLLAALLDAGAEVRSGARVTGLVLEDGAVVGVRCARERIDGRVVLATGGFQHDAGLASTHLRGPRVAALGTPGCAGDGLRMAEAAGAALGNMTEGWWMPAMHVPGETLDGALFYRPLHSERAQPGAVMIDHGGRRFVNEAQNYGDVGRAMQRVAKGERALAANPCWLVFDAGYRSRYPVGPLQPGDADPGWLLRADDIAGLAGAIGVPPAALEAAIGRFNSGAENGEDPEFGRGAQHYDRWIGDPGASHPTLAPLRSAPFYGLAVYLGCMGTKGGPLTDAQGRVLSSVGAAISGLYAAGNVAASPFGPATAAGGATLGPALVFGWRAGEAAVSDP